MKYYKVLREDREFFNLNEDVVKERFHHLCREVKDRFQEVIKEYPEFEESLKKQGKPSESLADKVYNIDLSASDQHVLLWFSEGVPEEIKSSLENHFLHFLGELVDKKINEEPVKV